MLYLSKNGVAAGSRGIFLGEIFIPVSEGISSAGGRGGVLCVKGSKPPGGWTDLSFFRRVLLSGNRSETCFRNRGN